MNKGDWSGKQEFQCAFGNKFTASPRLVLEGGHWCDECERRSWNYGNRAKVDPCESIPDPEHSIGIVEINGEGNAWRIVWGL